MAGVPLYESDLFRCPECAALVGIRDQLRHYDWHRQVERLANKAGGDG